MIAITEQHSADGTPVVRMESDCLRADVAPQVGGRIVSIVNKELRHEFLWRNSDVPLERLPAGSPYDPNFYGGVDELIPNDMPERIGGVECPDHGELWTRPLDWAPAGRSLVLRGTLPRFGLRYERRMTLREGSPHLDLDYRIENPTRERRHFLWRLHPALKAEPGDSILCPARTAQVSGSDLSRWKDIPPFAWPSISSERADILPPLDGTIACLFLYDLESGVLEWKSRLRHLRFQIAFDKDVFPCVCYFGSYGGFYGHYVIIPQPSRAMPISVNEAIRLGQCPVLGPGEMLETRISLYAGA